MKPSVTIECCHKCYWLLRAAYIAQGLLTTFESELDSVALKPSDVNGNFHISVDGKKIFEAMETTTRKELEEFLKYVIARPVKYAGNRWKLSEIFATWVINKSPQAITN